MRLIEESTLSFDEIRERFRWNVPQRYNIGVDICDRHTDIGDRTAVYVENAQGVEQTFTFADLKQLSDRFANALAGLGIRRGDRVGIILPQRIETAVAHIAIYKLGAVALPLSVLFGSDALAFRLADSGARALITDARRRDLIESIRPDLDDLRHVVPCDGEAGGFWDLVGAASDSFTPGEGWHVREASDQESEYGRWRKRQFRQMKAGRRGHDVSGPRQKYRHYLRRKLRPDRMAESTTSAS